MQTQQSTQTPNTSLFNINGFDQEALKAIKAIPAKIKQAIMSGKEKVVVMSFSVSKNFSFSKDDFDSLPGIQVYDYCHLQFKDKASLIYRKKKSSGRGRYDIVVAV